MRIAPALIASIALIATPAIAADNSAFYVGGDVGAANFDIHESDADLAFLYLVDPEGQGVLSASSSRDTNVTRMTVSALYRF